MDFDSAMRVLRVRMWEKGHTFDSIDEMSMMDFGDVIGYWQESGRVAEKHNAQQNRLRGR